MTKVMIIPWVKSPRLLNIQEKLGYEFDVTFTLSMQTMLMIVEEFLKENVNVKICHHEDGYRVWVDTKNFSQR